MRDEVVIVKLVAWKIKNVTFLFTIEWQGVNINLVIIRVIYFIYFAIWLFISWNLSFFFIYNFIETFLYNKEISIYDV